MKANIDSPSFTGSVQCANLQVASDGSLFLPHGSLPISVTDGLQQALDLKANELAVQIDLSTKADLGGAVYFNSVDSSDLNTNNLTADGAITLPDNSLTIGNVNNL